VRSFPDASKAGIDLAALSASYDKHEETEANDASRLVFRPQAENDFLTARSSGALPILRTGAVCGAVYAVN